MGKKKRTENAVVPRNPEDFLNDLKFIRKNRDNKANGDNPTNTSGIELINIDNTEPRWKADHDNVPAFFKSVQKLVKTKKIEKESKLV